MKNKLPPLSSESAAPEREARVPSFEPAALEPEEKSSPSVETYATADAHRVYWGKIAPRYDEVIDTMIGMEARASVLARFNSKRTLGHVVEIGCGTGYNTETLAANATQVVATDLSPGMLAVAQKRVRSTNVTFRVADCRRLPFDSQSFDTAVLGLVLHFARPEETLREILRVVRPGGSIFIVNPAVVSMGALARFGCRCRMLFHGITRYRLKPPGDFSNYLLSGEALSELLEWNGWTDIRLENIPSSSGPFGLPLEFIAAVRKPGLSST